VKGKEEGLRIIDGTWYMPNSGKDAWKDHVSARIPGAVFFDMDAVSDKTTNLPHMLPTESEFAIHMFNLGIKKNEKIICYDNLGLFSSPRIAWTMRFFGANRV
jgi:thiosulfate/3-mercaptopyruvate sulfurtransferase